MLTINQVVCYKFNCMLPVKHTTFLSLLISCLTLEPTLPSTLYSMSLV